MPGFHYFLPGVTKEQLAPGGTLSRELLGAAGLDTALFDVTKVPQHASLAEMHRCAGPWESTGTMLALVGKHTGVPELVVPDFNRQLWKPRGDPKKCWLGVQKGESPTAADLERWEQVAGFLLAAGQDEWRIPVARMPDPAWQFGHLPQSYVFSDAGEPEGRLNPAWQWLWDLSGQVRNWYVSDAPLDAAATPAERAAHAKPPFSWLVKQAAQILGVNYRVGLPELTFLHELGRGVLSQTTVHAVCQALFGFEVLEEAKKKQTDEASPPAPSSCSSTTGGASPAASPGTGRAGEG